MSRITTHVLDLASGHPAEGVGVALERAAPSESWIRVASGCTDADGRYEGVSDAPVATGTYRWVFATGDYFRGRDVESFHPRVEILFDVAEQEHYHVPLLLSPFGYSTYRGS